MWLFLLSTKGMRGTKKFPADLGVTFPKKREIVSGLQFGREGPKIRAFLDFLPSKKNDVIAIV